MSNPSQGTGSGGDRCTEANAAMIALTYKGKFKAPWPSNIKTGEQIMYWFTQMLNKGSNVSALEDAAWINKWFSAQSNGAITLGNIHGPSFQNIIDMVNRGHIGVGGFNNYASLKTIAGTNPYKWTDPQALGHVVIIAGYDTAKQAVIVYDPLRADPSGQPADYSWASFNAAQFSDLSEVNGPQLSAGSSIGGTLGTGAGEFLAPDASVSAFLMALDSIAQLHNPFNFTAAQDNISAGPVNFSFTDPISWAGTVSNNLWTDFSAICFRALIIAVGVVMLIALIQSWMPTASSQTAGTAVQAAAVLA